MSRDRTEERREVERTVESDGTAADAGGRSWGADFVPFGWPTLPSRGRSGGTAAAEQYDERTGAGDATGPASERTLGRDRRDETAGGWTDDGLITLLMVVGVALFLFPEPATSVVGLVLVGAGAVAWLVDLMT